MFGSGSRKPDHQMSPSDTTPIQPVGILGYDYPDSLDLLKTLAGAVGQRNPVTEVGRGDLLAPLHGADISRRDDSTSNQKPTDKLDRLVH